MYAPGSQLSSVPHFGTNPDPKAGPSCGQMCGVGGAGEIHSRVDQLYDHSMEAGSVVVAWPGPTHVPPTMCRVFRGAQGMLTTCIALIV